MLKTKLFIVFILVSNFFQLPGQVTVQGIVRDSMNRPIPFVTITAAFASQKAITSFAFTTDKGEYQINIPKSTDSLLILSASSIGFKKIESPLILKGEKNKLYY